MNQTENKKPSGFKEKLIDIFGCPPTPIAGWTLGTLMFVYTIMAAYFIYLTL